MLAQFFLYTAAVFTAIWGVAHLFPTASVVKGFGEISQDNKYIVYMEWITEGIALIFTGLLVGGTTFLGQDTVVSTFVYLLSSFFLIMLALISLFTGFKINFLPFKLCPFIFGLSALLIITGMII